MDEATNHLDVGREKAVNDTIRATSTRGIIAHRPETLRASSRVIVLEPRRLAVPPYRPPKAAKRAIVSG